MGGSVGERGDRRRSGQIRAARRPDAGGTDSPTREAKHERLGRLERERGVTRERWVAARRLHLWVAREPRPRIGRVFGSPVGDVFELLQCCFGPHFEI
jgi:hypothetical protein